MSARAGNLHWRRVHLELEAGLTNIDTLLKTSNRGYGADQPPLGIAGALPPVPGTSPGSRVMVIPLPPLAAWDAITAIGEPYFDTDTNTVHVALTADDATTINVLFWSPHTVESPGQADPYNDAP